MNTYNNIGKNTEFVPVKKYDDAYIVSFDKQVLSVDEETNEVTYIWKSFVYDNKKVSKSITDCIYDIINDNVTYLIENCFVWNGYNVHLNKENQMNYKAAFDLAINTNGESLPVTLRFYKAGKPQLYTFDILGELKDFYLKVNAHINKCLKDGWTKKDSINESDYKI